ncbi:MAG: hypothetical protein ACE5JG_08680, partial [Planctomycetota bacterium]
TLSAAAAGTAAASATRAIRTTDWVMPASRRRGRLLFWRRGYTGGGQERPGPRGPPLTPERPDGTKGARDLARSTDAGAGDWDFLGLRAVSVAADEPFLGAEPAGVILNAPVRDRARTEVKVRHAYDGDASRALDLVRAAVLVSSPDDLYRVLKLLDDRPGLEIVALRDRVLEPTPLGYRDLLVHFRFPPRDFVCAIQLQLFSILEAKRMAHPLYAEARQIQARTRPRRGFSVLVCDLFNYQVEEEEFLVDGFDGAEQATEFARRWVRDSLEELRGERRTRDEQRLLWCLFGEDAVVVGTDDEPCGYAGSSEVELFLDRPAAPGERDWSAVGPESSPP